MSPGQTLAANASWSFTITLSPSCSAPATGSWQITSQVANTNGQQTGPNVTGPATLYQATASTTAATSLSVVSGPVSWPFSYAFEEQAAAGSITYRVTAGGCSAWSVSVAAQPFTYRGPAGAAAIPVNNLALTTVGTPALIAGPGGTVATGQSTGGLGTTRQVVMASAGSSGTYEQTLGVTLTLPAGAPVGAYRSTIVLTAAAAPA
jgi:hypothetical protein